MLKIYQCVPNFSEGRDLSVVDAIADAIRSTPGALLIDASADPDHNRCVMTILGDAEAVVSSVLAAARIAETCVDLRKHSGVHPRAGAIDVVPVIPLLGTGRAAAVAVSERIGECLAAELGIPIYLYEESARSGRRNALPQLRRGGFEALRDLELIGEREPDFGPGRAHPTAGVTVVGARGPLVAYNVNLGAADASIARAIARRIREERDGVPEIEGVRALGVMLASQGRSQVTMNITRPERTPLPRVFAYVAREAARFGVTDVESEIIGVIPEAALGGASPESIRWLSYGKEQILETWLPGR